MKRASLIVAPLILLAGVWAAATIRLQTELLPLMPQDLPTVRGLTLFQQHFSSAQDVTVVLTNPAAAGDLNRRLRDLPGVEATYVLGGRQLDSAVQSVAWIIANLPPEKFARFRSLFTPAELDRRLETARQNLAGAVDLPEAAMVRLDPLGILPWLRDEAGITAPSIEANAAAIVVRSRQELRTFEQCQRFVDSVRSIVGDQGLLTGRPAFMAENSRSMRRDMLRMVAVSGALVALVFWLAYRSVAALMWMLPLQAISILAGVLAARLVFGELNVLSIGFAAILLGLGIDYCVVVYHFCATGEGNWNRLRLAVWMSAATTVAAFAALHFSRFPGLNQLALLVSVGLLTMAWLATTLLPVALRRRRESVPAWVETISDRWGAWVARRRHWIVGGALVGACCLPGLRQYRFYDPDLRRLRPADSEAYRGLDLLQQMRGRDDGVDVILPVEAAKDFALRPREEFLEKNRAQWQPGNSEAVRAALERAGFDADWGRATTRLLEMLDAWDFREPRLFLSNVSGNLALVRVPAGQELPGGASPVNWPMLATELKRTIVEDFRKLSALILGAVLALCWWTHRSWRGVLWQATGLAVAAAGLFALMFVTRETMTLMSLLALPLVAGLAVDYGLHMVLTLEEHGGDVRRALRQLSAPLAVMAITSVIGFGSPLVTRQPMLQNFGMVMMLGILSAAVSGLLVLPALYGVLRERPHYSRVLYRALWFEIGARFARLVGARTARATGAGLGWLYAVTHPRRCRVVRTNLALIGAKADARRVFANFGRTLADYFMIEPNMIVENIGSEHLYQLASRHEGALLVTVHLGLFELGSMLMPRIGQQPIVLSAPEPSRALGAWRARFRARWGAETLEVGNDNFSFVEITRRLKQGRCVAMLMDRPYDENFIVVDNIPFSTGPVWLSLLSGAPIVAGTVTALPGGGYRVEAHAPIYTKWLPEGRNATVEHYTKEVAAIFRDAICKHPDQWYQFVDLSALR